MVLGYCVTDVTLDHLLRDSFFQEIITFFDSLTRKNILNYTACLFDLNAYGDGNCIRYSNI